jgi:hypothetical protein
MLRIKLHRIRCFSGLMLVLVIEPYGSLVLILRPRFWATWIGMYEYLELPYWAIMLVD